MQEQELSFCGDLEALSQPGCQRERGYPRRNAKSTEPFSNLGCSQRACFLSSSASSPLACLYLPGARTIPLEMILTQITLLASAWARLGLRRALACQLGAGKDSLWAAITLQTLKSLGGEGGGRPVGRCFPASHLPLDAPSESSNLKAQSAAAGVGFRACPCAREELGLPWLLGEGQRCSVQPLTPQLQEGM